MKKKFLHFSWSELLFPIYNDIKNINLETNNNVTSNIWELSFEDLPETNDKIFSEIEKIREKSNSKNESFIVVDELKKVK